MEGDTDFKEDIDVEEPIEIEEVESIAMELLHEVQKNSKRLESILKTTIRAFAISVILIIAMFLGIFLYIASNFEFESYSQDGNGYNNINTGTQGDVNNGTEIPEN